jgi:phosphoesterase RecJ-like protein
MTIEIDHHDFREPFAKMQYVDTNAAAVGELVYELLTQLKASIDQRIAENIITSLIVETNSFRLPSVTAKTFQICADLMCCGIDFQRITNTIYWARSRNAALLSSLCLSRSVFLQKGELAWSIITQRDLKRYKARKEDVDAVADEMRAIKDVKIAILFREEEKGKLRVSLRSKGKINVAALARKYYGGGHYDVAGCVISGGSKTQQRFIAEAKRLLKQE